MTKLFKSAALAAAASAAMLASTAPASAATAFDAAAPTSVQTGAESWQHSRDRDYYRDGYRYRDSRYGDRGYRGRTWRGRNGRTYCRRPDGTTGLIVGGAVGALLGREIDGGYNRSTGTILGAAGGALLGRSIARDRVRCR